MVGDGGVSVFRAAEVGGGRLSGGLEQRVRDLEKGGVGVNNYIDSLPPSRLN